MNIIKKVSRRCGPIYRYCHTGGNGVVFPSETSCCSICKLISHTLIRGDWREDSYDFDLSIDEILELNCPKHHKLFKHFKDQLLINKEPRQLWPPERVSVERRIAAGDSACGNLMAYWYRDPDYYIHVFYLANRKEVPDHPGKALILDPNWIDMNTIKQWRERCTTEHGSKCLNKWKIPKTAPRWLIDTHTHCLVAGSKAHSYVCLSYRWGNVNRISTMKATLQKFQKPGSLNQARIRRNISPIILHAMQVVRGIGLRYLWADTLCIVQDDVQSKQTELTRMGAIYGSALLTIVSIYGDGERGLTYQEREMSNRALIFGEDQVHWSCQCADWSEDLLPGKRIIDKPVNFIAAGIPELTQLSSMIKEYNERILTYDSDGLNAISGMLEAIRPAFEGGFLFGLPIMFFDLALCWEIDWENRLRRRVRRGPPVQLSELPSWSWVGWQGKVYCCQYESGLWRANFLSRRTTTYPIVRWYASETPRESVKYPIRPSWFEKRSKMLDYNQPVPRGWNRYEYDAEKHEVTQDWDTIGPPEGLGQYVFEHENLPGALFWHPIPVSEFNSNADVIIPPTLKYISGKTTRTWLEAYREKPEQPYDDYEIVLRDRLGRKMGVLSLHSCDDVQGFNSYQPGEAGRGTMVEIVAICRQKTRDLDEYLYSRNKVYGEHEVYVILWVEWSNGVAYRKAVGRVEKNDWDQYPRLESIDLVLG
ncbi:heterokaryon incompatibility protein-domain-containing protein [Xylaria curta]|nr:heterokaryon incompatibility protein-domain-containing protein [Xylaria curta]